MEIINFGILDEAENLQQILSLISLLPNMIDSFIVISNKAFYQKLCFLCQIESKTFDLIRIKLK